MRSLTNILPKIIQIKTSNSLNFFFNFFTFSAASLVRFLKDQRVYLHMCSFQPALNGSFFGAGGLLLEYLIESTTFTFGTCRYTVV